MRAAFPLIATAFALAACVESPPQVTATPPTVSYQVTGNDVSQANVSAQHYCQQYAQAAQFQGIQPTATGNVAVYACNGGQTNAALAPAPPPPAYSGSSVPPAALCSDMMHQDRPGGTDYFGPPVPGCPARR